MKISLLFTIAQICLCVVYGLPEPEAALGAENIVTLIRVKRAGACTTTADCVAGNVCSKWGWCQWTDIYGSDGPSQGSSAPDGGKSGQCVTSADCASRVPYCSKLGFCHGGRLPFDEAQIEIPDGDKTGDGPQGYINNNPKKNNPILKNGQGTNKRKSGTSPASRKSGTSQASRNQRNQNSNNRNNVNNRNRSNTKQNSANGRRGSQKKSGGRSKSAQAANSRSGSGGNCTGGSLDKCVESCIPIKQVKAYGSCVEKCGRGC